MSILYSLLFSLFISLCFGNNSNDPKQVFCGSMPENWDLTKAVPWLQNPETDTCQKCTQYSYCAWCKSGLITDIYFLGISFPNVNITNFCWAGNPFTLTNNTIILDSNPSILTKFTISCEKVPEWKQCSISGEAAIGLVFAGISLVFCSACVGIICCCCCCRRRRGYSQI